MPSEEPTSSTPDLTDEQLSTLDAALEEQSEPVSRASEDSKEEGSVEPPSQIVEVCCYIFSLFFFSFFLSSLSIFLVLVLPFSLPPLSPPNFIFGSNAPHVKCTHTLIGRHGSCFGCQEGRQHALRFWSIYRGYREILSCSGCVPGRRRKGPGDLPQQQGCLLLYDRMCPLFLVFFFYFSSLLLYVGISDSYLSVSLCPAVPIFPFALFILSPPSPLHSLVLTLLPPLPSQKQYEDVVDDTTEAIRLDEEYVKALKRRAKAYEKLEKYMECMEGKLFYTECTDFYMIFVGVSSNSHLSSFPSVPLLLPLCSFAPSLSHYLSQPL